MHELPDTTRLTLNTQSKTLAVLNRATWKDYPLRDVFSY
jgi:hypothetical protein